MWEGWGEGGVGGECRMIDVALTGLPSQTRNIPLPTGASKQSNLSVVLLPPKFRPRNRNLATLSLSLLNDAGTLWDPSCLGSNGDGEGGGGR